MIVKVLNDGAFSFEDAVRNENRILQGDVENIHFAFLCEKFIFMNGSQIFQQLFGIMRTQEKDAVEKRIDFAGSNDCEVVEANT